MAMGHVRPAFYLCRQASRCIAPVASPGGNADVGKHRFMVGTCALQQHNEVHVIEFEEDTGEVKCINVLPHDDEIWLLSSVPYGDGRSIMTYSSGKPALKIWNVVDQQPQASLAPVSSLVDDEMPLTAVKSALWDTHHEGNVIVADAEALRVFQGGANGQFSKSLTLAVGQRCNAACLDPHHPHQVSTVDDAHLKTWDLRSGGGSAAHAVFKRDSAHSFGARDVEYNPNVPYQVVTAGEDATLRFWDLRQLQKCKKVLTGGHYHWTMRARFNHSHDQLLISCGTDSAVCLWRAGSIASAPLGSAGSGTSPSESPPADGLVKRYEDHDDSCYSCCWSASDAWVFASVSYDGKVAINRVPNEEKYRILL